MGSNTTVNDIYWFDPDNYDIYEYVFLNMMLQTCGSQGDTLSYIVPVDVLWTNFSDKQYCYIYEFLIHKDLFEADIRVVSFELS